MRIDESIVKHSLREIEKTTGRYRPRIENAVGRIVGMESAVVAKAVKEFLGSNDIPGFNARLEAYYGRGGAFLREARKAMYPVVRDFMELIQGDALDAVSRVATISRGEEFVRRYTRHYALRHASSSRRQLLKLVRDAGKPKVGKIKTEASLRVRAPSKFVMLSDLPQQAVTERINQWKQDRRRAKVVAMDESIRQSNAIARESWRTSGVTKLRWVTTGKSCPFCSQLHNRVVGIRQPFLEDGEVLTVQYEKKE